MISGSLIHLFSSLPKPKTNVTIKQLHPCITTTEAIATKNWKRGEDELTLIILYSSSVRPALEIYQIKLIF